MSSYVNGMSTTITASLHTMPCGAGQTPLAAACLPLKVTLTSPLVVAARITVTLPERYYAALPADTLLTLVNRRALDRPFGARRDSVSGCRGSRRAAPARHCVGCRDGGRCAQS